MGRRRDSHNEEACQSIGCVEDDEKQGNLLKRGGYGTACAFEEEYYTVIMK